MIQSSHRRIRRAPGQTGSETDGNTSRKRLAGSTSRNHTGSTLQQAQQKFGKRVQTLRQQHGLTQDQLGKDCGLPIEKMRGIEQGQVDADLFIMIRFANRLGTKLDRLLRGIK